MMDTRKPRTLIGMLALVFTVSLALAQSYAGTMFKGQFVGAGSHDASGMASIKNRTLTLSNIEVDRVPDGRIYLAMDADYEYGRGL